jgi:hypothetical protein
MSYFTLCLRHMSKPHLESILYHRRPIILRELLLNALEAGALQYPQKHEDDGGEYWGLHNQRQVQFASRHGRLGSDTHLEELVDGYSNHIRDTQGLSRRGDGRLQDIVPHVIERGLQYHGENKEAEGPPIVVRGIASLSTPLDELSHAVRRRQQDGSCRTLYA